VFAEDAANLRGADAEHRVLTASKSSSHNANVNVNVNVDVGSKTSTNHLHLEAHNNGVVPYHEHEEASSKTANGGEVKAALNLDVKR
jgi:hypothetical protein